MTPLEVQNDKSEWVITAGVLLGLNTLLFLVWIWQYYSLMKKRNEEEGDLAKHYFHCKSIFFQTLLVLLLTRFCQYALLLVLNLDNDDNNLPTSLSILFIDIQGIAAGLYLLVFATLLLFWFSFLRITASRSLEAVEKPYFYLFSTQVIVIFLVLSNTVISFYFFGAQREEAFFILQLIGFAVVLIAMVVGTVLAFILGYKVYKVLNNTSKGNLTLNQRLTKRSLQVVVISVIVTIMFILRICLMLYGFIPAVDNDDNNNNNNWRPTQGEAYQWYYYSVGWIPYLIYFIVGEDLPIAFLILFQSKLPKKNQHQLLFTMEAEEHQPTLQEFMIP